MLITINEQFNTSNAKHIQDSARATAKYTKLPQVHIKKWVSVEEAAALLSMDVEFIHKALLDGKLIGFEILERYVGNIPVYKIYIHPQTVAKGIAAEYQALIRKHLRVSKRYLQELKKNRLQEFPVEVN